MPVTDYSAVSEACRTGLTGLIGWWTTDSAVALATATLYLFQADKHILINLWAREGGIDEIREESK